MVSALCQTAGRGTNGRGFVSEIGGAYFSVVTDRHNFTAENVCNATLVAGRAMAETLREFGLSPVIVHGTQGARLADILAAEKAPVLCGPLICDRAKPELADLDPASVGILSANGVLTAIVTDHPVVPAQYLLLSAGLAVREGMDAEEALKAVTINAAKICGIADRVGSIELGKDADFAVFEQDPLLLSSKPCAVFVNGQLTVGN